MTTPRPLAGLIILFAFSGLPASAGALRGRGDPPAADAARELGHAFAALTRPPAGRALEQTAAGCHFRKRWSKTELLTLSKKLPAPQRLILLQHFNDDAFLTSAGILLANSGQLCNCPVKAAVNADIGISKNASLPTVLAGQPLSYTMQVSNFGPGTASSVSLSDPLDASLSFVSSTPGSPTCTLSGSTFNCSLGGMASGASQTITLNVTVSPSAGGSLANTASVSSATPDTYSPNNSQTATVTVTPLQPGRVPDLLLLTKTAGNPAQIDLAWTASCGNSVTGYGVYEGTLGSFYSHVPLNNLCAVAGLSVTGQPTAAVSTYYLVVPQSSPREGSYGVDSNSLEIPPSGTPCNALQVFGGVCP